MGRVSCLDCWGVLHRSNTSAVYRLALGEQIGQLLACSLCRGHPAQGHSILSSFEVDSDVESLVWHHDSWQLNDKLLTNDWVLVKDLVFKLIADEIRLLYIAHVNAIDGLAPNIEDDLVGEAENMHGVCDVSRDGLIVKVD